MKQIDFTAVLQIALWRNEGMKETEIRELLAKLFSNEIIQAGISLCDYLNSVQLNEGLKNDR